MTDLTDMLRELRTEVNSNVFPFGLKYCRRQSMVFIPTKEEVMLLFCGAHTYIFNDVISVMAMQKFCILFVIDL